MIWEPILLAVGFGVLVSAAIYFVVMWPQVEPRDEEEDEKEIGHGHGHGHGHGFQDDPPA